MGFGGDPYEIFYNYRIFTYANRLLCILFQEIFQTVYNGFTIPVYGDSLASENKYLPRNSQVPSPLTKARLTAPHWIT